MTISVLLALLTGGRIGSGRSGGDSSGGGGNSLTDVTRGGRRIVGRRGRIETGQLVPRSGTVGAVVAADVLQGGDGNVLSKLVPDLILDALLGEAEEATGDGFEAKAKADLGGLVLGRHRIAEVLAHGIGDGNCALGGAGLGQCCHDLGGTDHAVLGLDLVESDADQVGPTSEV